MEDQRSAQAGHVKSSVMDTSHEALAPAARNSSRTKKFFRRGRYHRPMFQEGCKLWVVDSLGFELL